MKIKETLTNKWAWAGAIIGDLLSVFNTNYLPGDSGAGIFSANDPTNTLGILVNGDGYSTTSASLIKNVEALIKQENDKPKTLLS